MHWTINPTRWVVSVAMITAATNILSDQTSNEENLKFLSSKEMEKEWRTFKIEYDKSYINAAEETLRKKIFRKNLDEIVAHNHLYYKGQKSFELGINEFTDMETAEFLDQMTGSIPNDPSDEPDYFNTFVPSSSVQAPDKIDWRTKGYVTPVKKQGRCGACWAFSTTGALEGQHFRRTAELVSLSEQQLVDCVEDNHGCKGGNRMRALKYIISNGGIATEKSYPYKAVKRKCRYKKSIVGATCKGFVGVRPRTELALKEAVARIGPIAVSIYANLSSFKHFKGGTHIYDDPECTNVYQTHDVLVVGYGKTASGKEYWIVKNSWGTRWANNGYIRMARNKNNLCGIASVASYPLV